MTTPWTIGAALPFCAMLESIAPTYGCHVALTGGTLYKPGPRKDCDIIVYRIRQVPEIDIPGLWGALEAAGVRLIKHHCWCFKAEYQGKPVDFLFPEIQAGTADGDGDGEYGGPQ